VSPRASPAPCTLLLCACRPAQALLAAHPCSHPRANTVHPLHVRRARPRWPQNCCRSCWLPIPAPTHAPTPCTPCTCAGRGHGGRKAAAGPAGHPPPAARPAVRALRAALPHPLHCWWRRGAPGAAAKGKRHRFVPRTRAMHCSCVIAHAHALITRHSAPRAIWLGRRGWLFVLVRISSMWGGEEWSCFVAPPPAKQHSTCGPAAGPVLQTRLLEGATPCALECSQPLPWPQRASHTSSEAHSTHTQTPAAPMLCPRQADCMAALAQMVAVGGPPCVDAGDALGMGLWLLEVSRGLWVVPMNGPPPIWP